MTDPTNTLPPGWKAPKTDLRTVDAGDSARASRPAWRAPLTEALRADDTADVPSYDPGRQIAKQAKLLAQSGKVSEAVTAIENGLADHPKSVFLLTKGASLYAQQKQYGRAETLLKRAYQVDPENPIMLNTFALFEADRGNYDPATAMLVMARQIDPKNLATLRNLNRIYAAQGRYDDAVGVLNDARKLDPKDMVTLISLGHLYLKKGDYSGFGKVAGEGAQVDPENASYRYMLAKGDYLQGNYASARAQSVSLLQKKFDPHVAIMYLASTRQTGFDGTSDPLSDAIKAEFGPARYAGLARSAEELRSDPGVLREAGGLASPRRPEGGGLHGVLRERRSGPGLPPLGDTPTG